MGTAEQDIQGWLDALRADTPTPGGGAAAGLAAAAGAALIAMVGRLTIDREGFDDVEARMRDLTHRAEDDIAAFVELADRDAEAFQAVMAAFRLPKATDEEQRDRTLRIQEAYEGAAAVPLEVARRAVDLMAVAEDATAMGNPNAASDGYSAGALLYAAGLAAMGNVRINAAGLKDGARGQALVAECETLRGRADELLAQIEEAFLLRLTP